MSATTTPVNGENVKMEDYAAPTTAIVRAQGGSDDAFRFALEPSGFKEAQSVAQIIAQTGMCGVKSPQEALVRLMTGRTLGIPSFVALQHVYDVEGRPSLSAKLKVALCLRHPDCEYFEHVESDHQHAVYKAKRRGQTEKRVTFTIEDATRAGLIKEKSNWVKWPRRMVQARASSELADIVFPDACMGMPTVEESRDEANAARDEEMAGEVVVIRPQPAQAAAMRDFGDEMALLKDKIAGSTAENRKALREELKRFSEEAGEPYAGELRAFYATESEKWKATSGAKP